MRSVRSFCRVCTSVCGILVDVDGDDVIAVHGDPDHPFSHGYTCPKGRALPRIHHHPDRLEHPLIRVDGDLRPTTWDACLDDLVDRLRAIIEAHGPESVGINFGTGVGMDAAGYRIAQGLHAAIGTPAKFSPLTIDGTAKVLIAELMGGTQAMTGRPDYDNATFAMFIGSNPVVSHGHTVGMPNPRGVIRELAKRAEVWIVDPRRTETARMSTHHLAPRPGTDYAVLAYLLREVLRDGADPDVPIQDVDRLAAAVAPFTRKHSAGVADVPEAQLTQLLASIRRSGRIAVDTGTGITMSPNANVTQWLCTALLVITGSMNRPGGMWFHPGFAYQLETFTLPVAPPERRSMWWVLAEIGRRLGHDLADAGATDDTVLARVGSGVRGGYDELIGTGWAESPIELPARWVDDHIDRVGGWRLAPRLLVEQLEAVREPAVLVLVPRRQLSRLNSQLEFLGEAPEVILHPDDAAAAGVADNAPVAVRTEQGELTGIAKVDPSVRRGAVSVPHGHAGANVNLLTSKDDIDPLTGMTRYSGIPVTLHPA